MSGTIRASENLPKTNVLAETAENPNEKRLFKFYLDKQSKYHNSRPEFLFRTNRWRFETLFRRPMAFAPWYNFNGWALKGAMAYLFYYYFLNRTPYSKHWNREGYYYEAAHKTSRPSY